MGFLLLVDVLDEVDDAAVVAVHHLARPGALLDGDRARPRPRLGAPAAEASGLEDDLLLGGLVQELARVVVVVGSRRSLALCRRPLARRSG